MQTYFLTIFKGLKPFWLQVKPWNWIKELLALEFCRNRNKGISILTETHINHDQIRHIRNNWLGSNFFSLGDSHTKGCLSCFIWDLKIDTDAKGRFVSFKFTPSNDRILCVYAPSGYSTREQLDRGRFFEGLQNYMENKNKIILEDFNCTMNKMVRMVKIKHRDFISAAPVMPCQNSSPIMGLRIYGEGRTLILLSSPAAIGPLARIQDRHGLYWYKNC